MRGACTELVRSLQVATCLKNILFRPTETGVKFQRRMVYQLAGFFALSLKWLINNKGTVRRKLMWVKSGINQYTFFYHWTEDILFLNIKGHHPINSIKLVFSV
jgi:hypothetical protein